MEDLGGAKVQAEISGNAHFYAESEERCFEQIKHLVSFIPWNNHKKAERAAPRPPRSTSASTTWCSIPCLRAAVLTDGWSMTTWPKSP